MTPRLSRRGVAAATALLAALAGTVAAPGASAVTRTLDLDYVCTFPLLKPEVVSMRINAEIPATAVVRQGTGQFDISATANVGPQAARGLRAVESALVEGRARAAARIDIPGSTPLPLSVPVDIAPTPIPATGGFSVPASGKTPSLVLVREGTVTVRMLDTIVLTLAPKLADGTMTGLDEFETECTIVPGQNMVLGTIEVGDGSGPQPDTTPPSKPGTPTGVASTTSISLNWAASTDAVGVTGYDVFKDGVKLDTVPSPGATVTGLSPDTEYRFSVQARDAAGNASAMSEELVVRTERIDSPTVPYSFGLSGTAQVNTLTRGPVPLSGSIDANLTLSTGEFEANLVLNRTRSRLLALGFIPITADVGFIQSGQTTGTLKSGLLKTKSLMRIRLPQVYLFGAIPIAGPGTCQTKRLSEVNLTSTGEFFNPLQGGTLTGTYAISDLTGCGALNGLISPLVAGGGNTISINLTPQAGA